MPLTLAAWLHDLSPFLIDFGSGLGIRWYGLSYAAGFLLAWWALQQFSRRALTPLNRDQITNAMLTLVLGVVVGGRLGYCLAYQPSLFSSFSPSFPWWGVLRLNEGGMASHGGMVGVAAACVWVWRSLGPARPSLLHLFDLVAFACTPGLLLGRVANFINGELLGSIVAMPGRPAPWWAVKFPQEAYTSHAPPGQEQALVPLLDQYRLAGETDPQVYDRVVRLLQSSQPGAAKVAAQLDPLISARHPSQLYQAFAEGIVLGVALLWVWRRPRTPGVIGACFLLFYGVLRVATEFVRLPDANLAVPRPAGLSRGQWLSVAMIAAAAALFWCARRWGGPKLGGWGAQGPQASSGQ
jgi:phosphatidylglycerol---prolipoprotein diacylglyceryl transferase